MKIRFWFWFTIYGMKNRQIRNILSLQISVEFYYSYQALPDKQTERFNNCVSSFIFISSNYQSNIFRSVWLQTIYWTVKTPRCGYMLQNGFHSFTKVFCSKLYCYGNLLSINSFKNYRYKRNKVYFSAPILQMN